MNTREDELEAFKTQINLSEFAVTEGFEIDRAASSRNSVGMKHSDGSKIIIARGTDGHWIYFSVHDPQDHGSIIDFVQRRQGGTLGHVRRELRPWIGAGAAPLPSRPLRESFVSDLAPATGNVIAVRARYEAMSSIDGYHAYLAQQRCIPPALLSDDRFASRIRVDHRRNAIFSHFDRDGLCGFEIKNDGFTGFAPGGAKGLWCSHTTENDERLVIAETAIDALSYAALFGHDRTRFVSIAGQMNPNQPALLTAAMQKMPLGSQVIATMDNDTAGRDLAGQIEDLYSSAGCSEIAFRIDCPPTAGQDWNDALRATTAQQPQPDGPG